MDAYFEWELAMLTTQLTEAFVGTEEVLAGSGGRMVFVKLRDGSWEDCNQSRHEGRSITLSSERLAYARISSD